MYGFFIVLKYLKKLLGMKYWNMCVKCWSSSSHNIQYRRQKYFYYFKISLFLMQTRECQVPFYQNKFLSLFVRLRYSKMITESKLTNTNK